MGKKTLGAILEMPGGAFCTLSCFERAKSWTQSEDRWVALWPHKSGLFLYLSLLRFPPKTRIDPRHVFDIKPELINRVYSLITFTVVVEGEQDEAWLMEAGLATLFDESASDGEDSRVLLSTLTRTQAAAVHKRLETLRKRNKPYSVPDVRDIFKPQDTKVRKGHAKRGRNKAPRNIPEEFCVLSFCSESVNLNMMIQSH